MAVAPKLRDVLTVAAAEEEAAAAQKQLAKPKQTEFGSPEVAARPERRCAPLGQLNLVARGEFGAVQ